MTGNYPELRGRLKAYGLTVQDVADLIDKSRSYVNKAFAGNLCFDLNEAYTILDAIGVPESKLPQYFPKNKKSIRRNKTNG